MNADGGYQVPREASTGSRYLLYLYCIVASGTEAHRLLERRGLPGMEPGEPLFPVEAGGLVAAVSRVPAASFQEESLNALLAELPRVAPLAVRHEQAISSLLPLAPVVVPVSLGAVYRSAESVAELLDRRGEELRGLLAALAGKQEWGVKVFRESWRLLEAAEASSQELQRLADEAAQSSPGRAYLLRKQRERLLAGEADRLARQWLDAMLQALQQASDSMRVDQLLDVPRGEPALVLKAAFLVRADAVDAFRSVVASLEGQYAPVGLQLELNGPWAPYSFVGDVRGREATTGKTHGTSGAR